AETLCGWPSGPANLSIFYTFDHKEQERSVKFRSVCHTAPPCGNVANSAGNLEARCYSSCTYGDRTSLPKSPNILANWPSRPTGKGSFGNCPVGVWSASDLSALWYVWYHTPRSPGLGHGQRSQKNLLKRR